MVGLLGRRRKSADQAAIEINQSTALAPEQHCRMAMAVSALLAAPPKTMVLTFSFFRFDVIGGILKEAMRSDAGLFRDWMECQ